METIRHRVLSVRRRLNVQRFLRFVPWTLLAGCTLAALAVALPKIWVIETHAGVWLTSWILGGLSAGLLSALLAAFLSRRTMLDAAHGNRPPLRAEGTRLQRLDAGAEPKPRQPPAALCWRMHRVGSRA